MNRLLLLLYPRRWRVRYGDEFEDLLEQEGLRPGIVADVILHALAARLDLRRHGVRAAVATVVLIVTEWYAYSAGYPNALWLPRGIASAALLMMVLGVLGLAIEAAARLVARNKRHRVRG